VEYAGDDGELYECGGLQVGRVLEGELFHVE